MARKILCIAGTRPEVIKIAPVVRALREQQHLEVTMLLTGQHRELAPQILADFQIKADGDLKLMQNGQHLSDFTGRAFLCLGARIRSIQPDMVLAQGDTTTALVAATLAFYARIPFGHIEAGLRTGNINSPFPEEFNRIVISRIATLHFAPTANAAATLTAEGVDERSIVVTGNTGIDALAEHSANGRVSVYEAPPGRRLVLLTSHRRENVGEQMREAFGVLQSILRNHSDVDVLFPVHPNPRVRSIATEIFGDDRQVKLVDSLSYLDFVAAMQAAYVIITDSGGVQEEAPWLRKPVLILRDETERPEALQAGVAALVGGNGERLRRWLRSLLNDPKAYSKMANGASPYGDGKASRRIVQSVLDYFELPLGGPRFPPFISPSTLDARASGAL